MLSKRLVLWKDGEVEKLVRDERTIQSRIGKLKSSDPPNRSKVFAKLVLIFKIIFNSRSMIWLLCGRNKIYPKSLIRFDYFSIKNLIYERYLMSLLAETKRRVIPATKCSQVFDNFFIVYLVTREQVIGNLLRERARLLIS